MLIFKTHQRPGKLFIAELLLIFHMYLIILPLFKLLKCVTNLGFWWLLCFESYVHFLYPLILYRVTRRKNIVWAGQNPITPLRFIFYRFECG